MKFTLSQMFTCVTLIAIGFGMIWPIFGKRILTNVDFVACPLAGTMIGAGLFTLGNRPLIGALIGFAVGAFALPILFFSAL